MVAFHIWCSGKQNTTALTSKRTQKKARLFVTFVDNLLNSHKDKHTKANIAKGYCWVFADLKTKRWKTDPTRWKSSPSLNREAAWENRLEGRMKKFSCQITSDMKNAILSVKNTAYLILWEQVCCSSLFICSEIRFCTKTRSNVWNCVCVWNSLNFKCCFQTDW